MSEDKFIPTPLDEITSILECFVQSPPLARNISYTLQYCQYLKHLIINSKVTAVIQTQLYKAYIISGISVIEAILYSLLLQEGKVKMSSWKQIGEQKEINVSKKMKVELKFFKEVEGLLPKSLKFSAILSKVKHLKIFEQHDEFFKDIAELNELRNKVHLHTATDWGLSDYNKFSSYEFKKMEKVLNHIIPFLKKEYKIFN